MGHSKKTIYILLIGLLWAIPSWARSPGPDYPCRISHYDENLKNAKFIIVAKLEKYLPEHKGEYRVLMTLRGNIVPGSKFVEGAMAEIPDAPRGGYSDPLNYNYIFLGEDFTANDSLKIVPYECDGKHSASTIECNWGYMCKAIKSELGIK